MKYKSIMLLIVSVFLAAFMACDWNNHTEPEIKVDNIALRGMAIYVNRTPIKPQGEYVLTVNEGDTLSLQMTTDLLETPEYVFTPGDNGVLEVVNDAGNNMMAYAIAKGDSGTTTTLKIYDSANKAEKEIAVVIEKHWADPDYYTYIGSLDGHYYYLSNNLRGWVQAEELCREAGGYMAVINSVEENQLLDQGRGMIENVWIGLRFNKNAEDEWELEYWVNGDQLEDNYQYFASKPSDPGIFAEYYFHMDVNGRWENWHEISYNFFLEME